MTSSFTQEITSAETAQMNNCSLSSGIQCIPSDRVNHFVEMSINTTSLVVNFFLCLSLLVYRRKLRQHMINLYAANLVFAHFVLIFAITAISYMEYFGNSRELNGVGPQPSPFVYFWFTLRVCTFVMFLVICGGIGLLMVAMKKNMFRVHRTVAGLSRESVQTLQPRDQAANKKRKTFSYRILYWIKKNRKTVAVFQIAAAWFIPIILSTAAYHDGGYCLCECHCLLNYIPSSSSIPSCSRKSGCSTLLPGLNNVAIVVEFSCWVVCVVILFFFFVQCYFNFVQVMMERKQALKAQSLDNDPRERENNVTNVDEKNGETPIVNYSSQAQQEKSPKLKIRTLDRVGANMSWNNYSKSLLSESLKRNLLFLCLVAVVFAAGTAPFVIMVFTSVFIELTDEFHNGVELVIVSMIMVVTTLLNSIILCSTHFGLNVAINSMVRAIVQCRCFKKKK